MTAVDERTYTPDEGEFADEWFPGTDPGDAENWEIRRVCCPACDRPIALLGDEDRIPLHALLPSAWQPFSSSVCVGSGRDAVEGRELRGESPDPDAELEAMLTLPPELDWRTQPFSHAH